MNKDTRMTFRLPKELRAMTDLVAGYEDRTSADLVNVALKHYFKSKGYLDPAMAEKLATNKEKTTP